jgi:thiamine biosynthesis lipoprotein
MPVEVGFEFEALGTVCQMRLCAPTNTVAADAARVAIAEVRRIEAKYSRYRADSVVSRINAAAGTGVPVGVDEETATLLRFADTLHAASEGRFDITSGILRRVWDFKSQRVPSEADVSALLPDIGWQQVDWNGAALSLPRSGMELDFGGFGKEYAADRAAAVLHGAGVTGGTVNLGGDVSVVGPRPDGQPWRIGIAHPRKAGGVIASIEMTHGALATSGDYERAFEVDGRRYCHILDPRTGWPVTCWQSVSVAGPACLASGALTTIAMLMGEDAHAFLQSQGVGYLTVDAGGQVHRDMP